jgi:fatty acid/phospholipid biosynthesis enzyme
MKTIIIDIPSGLAAATSVLSALKVYAKKNKIYQLLVCGSPNDMSILEDIENIQCAYSEGAETSTSLALSHINDPEVAGFLSFNERPILIQSCHQNLPKEVNPCFGLYFASQSEGKETLLIDAGGFSAKTKEDVDAYRSYGVDYLKNILKKGTISIAYLALPEMMDEQDVAIDAFLKASCPEYSGVVDPEYLFDGKNDIVLAGGISGALAIRSAKGSRRVAHDLEQIRSSKSFAVKWSSLLGAKDNGQDRRYDPRIDAKGYLLFGYGHHIVDLDKTAGFGDVIDALDTLERFDRNQPFAK